MIHPQEPSIPPTHHHHYCSENTHSQSHIPKTAPWVTPWIL